MSGVNQWDRARMDAGIADPGSPHDIILHAAERLFVNTYRDGRGFDDLPEADRAHWLARAARTVVASDHPLYPAHIPAAATGAL